VHVQAAGADDEALLAGARPSPNPNAHPRSPTHKGCCAGAPCIAAWKLQRCCSHMLPWWQQSTGECGAGALRCGGMLYL